MRIIVRKIVGERFTVPQEVGEELLSAQARGDYQYLADWFETNETGVTLVDAVTVREIKA